MLLAGVVIMALAACNDSGTETTVRTPNSDDEPAISTGIGDVDHIVNTALAVEGVELAGLTGYQHIPCVEESEGAASPPVCRETEEVGQEVEAYPVLQCELAWMRPEVLTDVYLQALGDDPRLVTIYRPQARPLVLEADYVAVFDTNTGDDRAGVALSIQDGRIVQVEYDCNNFAGLYADEKVQEFVVAPEGGDVADDSPEADDEGEG
jgi:hypothetical protein